MGAGWESRTQTLSISVLDISLTSLHGGSGDWSRWFGLRVARVFSCQSHRGHDLTPHPDRQPDCSHIGGGNIFVSASCLSLLTPALLSLQYEAEFRRFSVDRAKPGKFEEFYKLLLHIHRIANMEVMICYTDIHGDLLPINNDDNFCKAVSTAHPVLRIIIQRQGGLTHAFFF